MELHNPLWDFALELYAKPGIEAICLDLQNEHKLSINRLIFAVWAAKEQKLLDLKRLTSSDANEWQQPIAHPLRSVRYKVRERLDNHPELENVYKNLRKAELQSEQVEIAYLYYVSQGWGRSASSASELLKENLSVITAKAPKDSLAEKMLQFTSLVRESLIN